MRITAKPKFCLLYFDFEIGESFFEVEIKQNIGDSKEIGIKVWNNLGDPITDQNLISIIREYSIRKYSIGYDDTSQEISNHNSEVRLDPPI